MTAGIYDQLSQLEQVPPAKTSTVGSPDAPKTVKLEPKAQSHTLEGDVPANRTTAPQPASQAQPATPTSNVTSLRDHPRERSSENPRGKSRELPTREEVQEFTFRMRDELKIKVQAEVPHKWQDELEEIARTLDVKKLELYRFIIGEFLGKVQRKRNA